MSGPPKLPKDTPIEPRSLSKFAVDAAKSKSTLGVSDSDDMIIQDPTPVRDMSQGQAILAIGEVQKNVNALVRVSNSQVAFVRQIPEIKKEVLVVSTKLGDVDRRVGRLEDKTDRSHDCYQTEAIEEVKEAALSLRKEREDDTLKVMRTTTELESIYKSVQEIKDNEKSVADVRRSNFYFWIGTALSFIATVLGAVWYLRGLSADIQMESTAREMQFRQVENLLNRVSTSTDPAPMMKQIKQLKTAVEAGDVDEWCGKLSDSDVKRIKSILPRQSWPKCARLGTQ